MVSGNLLLAFFTDKIRLDITVYTEKHFFIIKKYFGDCAYGHNGFLIS